MFPSRSTQLPAPWRGWRRRGLGLPRTHERADARCSYPSWPRGSGRRESQRLLLFSVPLPWGRRPGVPPLAPLEVAPRSEFQATAPALGFPLPPSFLAGEILEARGSGWPGSFLTVCVTATCFRCSRIGNSGLRIASTRRAGGARPDCHGTQGSRAEEGRHRWGGVLFCSIIYLRVCNFYNFFSLENRARCAFPESWDPALGLWVGGC